MTAIGGRRVRAASLLLTVLFGTVSGFPALASTGSDQASSNTIRLVEGRVDAPNVEDAGHTSSMWVWSAGRRAYRLTHPTSGRSSPFQGLASVDLDTGEVVEEGSFPTWGPAWVSHPSSGTGREFTRGMPNTGAVDEVNGRLFVAHQMQSPIYSSSGAVSFAAGRGCVGVGGGTTRSDCLAGYHVIDGRTLEVVRTLPLTTVRADDVAVITIPRMTTYLEARPDGGGDKLLAMVTEEVVDQNQGMSRWASSFELERVLLVQWDVASGRQEWTLVLSDCRSTREGSMDHSLLRERPNPAAIFSTPTGDALWVGCHVDTAFSGGMVRVPLDADGVPADAIRVADPPDASGGPPAPPTFELTPAEVYRGPEGAIEFWADPPSERVLIRSIKSNPDGEAWTVFDGKLRQYLGSIGTGRNKEASGSVGIDATEGRFYVLQPEGLYVADIRRTPLQQALFFPEIASSEFREPDGQAPVHQGWPLVIDTGSKRAPRRVLYPVDFTHYRILEDFLPLSVEPPQVTGRRTLDLGEAPAVTMAAFDGAARGYGARLLLIAGAEAMTRWRAFDVVGVARNGYENARTNPPLEVSKMGLGEPQKDRCADENREIVLAWNGQKGPAVADASGARGSSVPVVVDGTTVADLKNPVSRCTAKEWDAIWARALFGRAPVGEPAAPADLLPAEVECVEGEGEQEARPTAKRTGDASSPFFASVQCESGAVQGFSYARGGTPELHVAEALSSFRIYRDPGRGIVSRVESIARGVQIAGVVSIEVVRGVAESWANGRSQPVSAGDREAGYDANCDLDRTAGTCFRRNVFGVRSAVYSCGPCGDEEAFMKGMNSIMRGDGRWRFGQPDEALTAGSEDGFTAAVVKKQADRFADLTFNQDTVQTVVPTLEFVRYAPPARHQPNFDGGPTQGRQIYQFAGVEVSSSYSIQCLLEYDAATNTCAAAKEAPGSLALELTTPDGKPLAGGAFELRADTNGDGVVGLVDKLVPEGACVTADDGVGTCRWESLAPGKYVVTQIAAPPGHSVVNEPYPVELVSGEARTVTFTNVSNISTIDVSVADEHDKPLAGAKFAVYDDPDADGKVAPDAKPAAQCETGPDGGCTMLVPVGSYVLVQVAAPDGLEPIEPVAFALTSGGETAAVTVVNYPPDVVAPPPAAGHVDYLPPAPPPPPQLHAVPLPVAGIPMDDEPEIAGPGLGGTIVRVAQAPGDVLRLLARDPVQAAAFAATLLLLTLAWAGVQRRRQLTMLTGDLSG
jgi:hypothetical protein